MSQKEVINVRENVGVIEVANFSKHEFKGADARKFLDHILAGRLPKPEEFLYHQCYIL